MKDCKLRFKPYDMGHSVGFLLSIEEYNKKKLTVCKEIRRPLTEISDRRFLHHLIDMAQELLARLDKEDNCCEEVKIGCPNAS